MIDTFTPLAMKGSDAGSSKYANRRAPEGRKNAASSAVCSPARRMADIVFTSIGKKITMITVITRGVTPKPNHSTRNGARATEGIVLAATSQGIRRRERVFDLAMP